MALQDLFWWPSTRRHVLGFSAAAAVVCFLGIAQIPGFPSVKDLTSVQGSIGWLLLLSALIGAANFYFLHEHASGDYLDQCWALLPIGVTLVALSIAFSVAWVLYRLKLGNAAFPDLAALFDGAWPWLKRAAVPDSSVHEWTRAARALFVGESSFTAVLLFSGLWKEPARDTIDVIDLRDLARRPLRRLFCEVPPPQWGQEQAEQFLALLDSIRESAQKLRTRDLSKADHEFAAKLADSAELIRERLSVRPVSSWPQIRGNADVELKKAAGFLLGKTLQ